MLIASQYSYSEEFFSDLCKITWQHPFGQLLRSYLCTARIIEKFLSFPKVLYNPPRSWFLVKSPTVTGAIMHQCMQAKDLSSTRSHLGLISKRILDNHSPLSY